MAAWLSQATVVFVVIKLKDGEGLNQSREVGGVNGNAEDLRPERQWLVWDKWEIIPID